MAQNFLTAYIEYVPVGPLNDPAVLVASLEKHRWLISDTALDLGVSRQAVYDAIRRFEIPRHRDHDAFVERAKEAGDRGNRKLARMRSTA